MYHGLHGIRTEARAASLGLTRDSLNSGFIAKLKVLASEMLFLRHSMMALAALVAVSLSVFFGQPGPSLQVCQDEH